jgi:hypothetical protein
MNRLRGSFTYLIGAIDRVINSEDAIDWRQNITPFLQSLGVIVLDPTNKPVVGLKEDEEIVKNKEKYIEDGKIEEFCLAVRRIRSFDLRCVDLSSFIIAYIDTDIHLCGSYEEIFSANKEKKPCLIVVKQGKSRTPRWILGAVNAETVFNNFDELKQYLKHIDQDQCIDTLRRWVFIDFSKLISPLQPKLDTYWIRKDKEKD